MNIDVNKIKKSFIISLSLPLVDCHQNINNIQNAKIYKNFVKHQTLPNMTRNDYFQIIGELIEVYHDNPVVLDELLDIELSLMGHCSKGCIERFHDEPVNQEALVSYVRGLM